MLDDESIIVLTYQITSNEKRKLEDEIENLDVLKEEKSHDGPLRDRAWVGIPGILLNLCTSDSVI